MTHNLLISVLSLFVVGLAGCEIDQPCDADQVYRNYLCYDVPPDAGAPPVDADPADESKLGASCVVAADCTVDTDFCMILPAAPAGYCTRTGCIDDPSRCPDGWACLDLSVYQPGLPAICTMP